MKSTKNVDFCLLYWLIRCLTTTPMWWRLKCLTISTSQDYYITNTVNRYSHFSGLTRATQTTSTAELENPESHPRHLVQHPRRDESVVRDPAHTQPPYAAVGRSPRSAVHHRQDRRRFFYPIR